MILQPYVTINPAASPDGAMRYAPPVLPVTGYRDLDEAHEKLSARLADLGTQIESGLLSSAITTAVALLFELREDYAIEEALMFRTGFPDYARHQASHAVLEQTFSNLSRWIRSAESGSPGAESRAELIALLNAGGRMLAAHVLGADVALTKYVMGRDATGRPGPG